ncbi:hypothetical protein HK105_204700 [Polyrhizophydium stewartii]|uniref:Uncharacterized protein n=1 Tax=Polyrhizophydium stewartii TaxID=2732419 RepID=A0ABR4N8H4_9FUNG
MSPTNPPLGASALSLASLGAPQKLDFLDDSDDLDSLSEQQLRLKLRDALRALQEKDKDLLLAAEIGAQLVEINNSLVSDYENLLEKKGGSDAAADGVPTPSTSPQQSSVHMPAAAAEPADAAAALDPSSLDPNVLRQQSLFKRRSAMSLRQLAPLSAQTDVAAAVTSPVQSPSHGAVLSPPPSLSADLEAIDRRARSHTHSRKPSGSFFEYIATLERANAELRQQLDTATANLRDSDASHARNVKTLRANNEALQKQLRETMTEMRDEANAHAQTVSSLESDMEYLRAELSRVAQTAAELETEKRRLLKEKMDTFKETKHIENVDQELIAELLARVNALEAENDRLSSGKLDLDRRFAVLREEHAEALERIADLTVRAEEGLSAREAYQSQSREMDEMRDQLEDMRNRLLALHDDLAVTGGNQPPAPPGAHLVLTQEGWEWTPWLERARIKAWERDINGLRDEINYLRAHQNQAYNRLKNELGGLVGRLMVYVPNPLKPLSSLSSITSSVIGTVTSPIRGTSPSAARSPTPSKSSLPAAPPVAPPTAPASPLPPAASPTPTPTPPASVSPTPAT